VLFYFNSNSSFYTNLFYSIKRGFEENDCEIKGEPYLLNEEDLAQEISSFSPDFVLEINRTKSEIKNFPKNIIHISWIFDLWNRNPQDLYSDIIYTFGHDWLQTFPKSCAKYIACLPPATDESIFKSLNMEKLFDFSFFGHIPKPWNTQELSRVVGHKNDRPIYFKDIIEDVESGLLSKYNPFLAIDNQFSFKSFQKKHQFEFVPDLTHSLQYDITTRVFRQKNRLNFLNIIKETSSDISIYGTNWELYDDFSSFYKGYIDSPDDVNKAIQESKIMLHDNHNLHFRILDAMANGTPVTVTTPRESGDVLELYGLIKDIHYLEVDIFEKNYFQIPSNQILNHISTNAMKLVKGKHLWRHRAETILNDIVASSDLTLSNDSS